MDKKLISAIVKQVTEEKLTKREKELYDEFCRKNGNYPWRSQLQRIYEFSKGKDAAYDNILREINKKAT